MMGQEKVGPACRNRKPDGFLSSRLGHRLQFVIYCLRVNKGEAGATHSEPVQLTDMFNMNASLPLPSPMSDPNGLVS